MQDTNNLGASRSMKLPRHEGTMTLYMSMENLKTRPVSYTLLSSNKDKTSSVTTSQTSLS